MTTSGAAEIDPRLSSKFGKYQILASLGHGGMADVYLALSHGPAGFNKLVVIKRLRPNLAEEPDFLEMFLDEARLAARLNHPNVVQTNEVGEAGGHYFIAMEYLEGQPLNRIMNRVTRAKKPLPPAVFLPIMCDTLAGLHHAHELKDYDGTALQVVHRDASPHNIFVTYEGQTKLVDFGIAKAATRSVETRTGILKGKVQYMPPEQARCGDVDCRADVFSVGVVLWELLTGMRLWKGLTDVQILERLVTGVPPRARDFAPEAPPRLEEICAKAMAVDPADRFATAAEFREALEEYMQAQQVGASPKEIGALVGEVFADKREWLRGIVESQIAKAQTGLSDPVHLVDPMTLATPLAGIPALSPSSPPGPSIEGTPSGMAPGAPLAATPVSQYPVPVISAARDRRRAGWMVAAAGSVVALLFVAMLSWGPADDSAPKSEAAALRPAETEDTAAPVEPADGNIGLKVRAPEGATLFLDGIPLKGNPFDGRFYKDGTTHKLVVEKDGYVTDKRMVVFDRDIDLTIELSPVKQAPRPFVHNKGFHLPPPSKVPPAGASADDEPGASGELTPGTAPKRELEKIDPWAAPEPK